jgi:hypothetical protein
MKKELSSDVGRYEFWPRVLISNTFFPKLGEGAEVTLSMVKWKG